MWRPPKSTAHDTLFPNTTLCRSDGSGSPHCAVRPRGWSALVDRSTESSGPRPYLPLHSSPVSRRSGRVALPSLTPHQWMHHLVDVEGVVVSLDRKSTRLNSSH